MNVDTRPDGETTRILLAALSAINKLPLESPVTPLGDKNEAAIPTPSLCPNMLLPASEVTAPEEETRRIWDVSVNAKDALLEQ